MSGVRDIASNVIVDVAKKAPRCPHCKKKLDLTDILDLAGIIDMIFRRILAVIKGGERVQISGFGSFQANDINGRELFDGEIIMPQRKLKSYGTALLNRSSLNRLKSWEVSPRWDRSAIISPTTLQNLKPCPENPAAMLTCG